MIRWGIDADDNRGIEKIDLKNKKSELWVSGAELGGGVNLMEVNAKEGKAYVAVYRAYGDVFVVEVDLASKSVKSVGKEVDATGGLFFDADKRCPIGLEELGWPMDLVRKFGAVVLAVWRVAERTSDSTGYR